MDISQFSLVKPPTLTRHDRTSIIAFLRDWTQYQENTFAAMTHASEGGGDDDDDFDDTDGDLTKGR